MLKLVVVGDEELYRALSEGVLAGAGDCHVTAAHAAAILKGIHKLDADAVILDIQVPGSANCLELGLRLKEARPKVGLVLLSSDDEPALVRVLQWRHLAGWAFLLKDSLDRATFRSALQRATKGDVMVDPAVAARWRARGPSPLARLTQRQREVLELIVEGYSNQGIAQKLCVSRKTVENTINQMYQQLGIDSRDPKIQPRVTLVMQYFAETMMGSPFFGATSILGTGERYTARQSADCDAVASGR